MANAYGTTHPAYDAVARTLHWLTVLLVAMQFVIGWTMPDVHKDTQPVNLIAWHLGVGATLVAVMAIRVIWRLTHWPTPDKLPPLLSVVSRITHECVSPTQPPSPDGTSSFKAPLLSLASPYPGFPSLRLRARTPFRLHSRSQWILLASTHFSSSALTGRSRYIPER